MSGRLKQSIVSRAFLEVSSGSQPFGGRKLQGEDDGNSLHEHRHYHQPVNRHDETRPSDADVRMGERVQDKACQDNDGHEGDNYRNGRRIIEKIYGRLKE